MRTPKKISIYGIYTFDDEFHGSYKTFTITRDLAVEELKKYCDYGENNSPKPDKYHIKSFDLIVGYEEEMVEEKPVEKEKDKAENDAELLAKKWEEIGNKLYNLFNSFFDPKGDS